MSIALVKEGLAFIGGMFGPVKDLVDELHHSGEEKGELKIKLTQLNIELEKLQSGIVSKVLDLEAKIADYQHKVLTIELSSGNWIQKSWRPLSMAAFTVLIIGDNLGWLSQPIKPQVYEFYKIGMTGYILGRSGEKILKSGGGELLKSGASKIKGLLWK